MIGKILCAVGIHWHFRASRFNNWHCGRCGKFLEIGSTYDNGHLPKDYKGKIDSL